MTLRDLLLRLAPATLAAILFGPSRPLRAALAPAGAWLAVEPEYFTSSAHFLGTCRMGRDPRESVVDADHRRHDMPDLFLCDGSGFVTSGRGRPTCTISALAIRAGERMAAAARRGEI